jgi:endonuclease/exonuclease/phosphatase family metal-dependent hydrolase
MLRRLGRVIPYALLVLLVLSTAGRVVRDRSAWLALLLYLPMLLLGAAAVAYDLLRRGRSLRRGRFVLAGIGAAALAWEAGAMTGWRGGDDLPTAPAAGEGGGGGGRVTLVHWNVQWGGSRRGTDEPWRAITAALRERGPDVVVLSEAPPEAWVRRWAASMGPAWSAAFHEGTTSAKYRSQLAVCSRWPVHHERDVRLPNGSGFLARIDVAVDGVGTRPLRVLVADGRSKLSVHRTPMLAEVARLCDEAGRAGRPIDVIAGDFNAVARSLGFDAVRRAGGGYALASEHSGGWRGTFPSVLPLYDIDHVWVHEGTMAVESCDLFTNLATDHRGQAVRLRRR